MESAPTWRPTGWLKTALVADLIVADLADGGEREREQPLRDEGDWTDNLARQLGLRITRDDDGDVHQTLLLILRQIGEILMAGWPPIVEERECREVVVQATKDLRADEVFATLLAGRELRSESVGPVPVHELPTQLRAILNRRLTSDLRGLLLRWVEWEVPKLRARQKEATEAAPKAAKAAPAAASPPTPLRRRTLEAKDRTRFQPTRRYL